MTERRAFYLINSNATQAASIRRPAPSDDVGVSDQENPAFLLISLPGGWPPGGTVLSTTLVIVRDEVPGQGIAVDTLPVNLDVKAGSLERIREWLKCL